MVTTSIYINQRPVIKLTQPTGAALVYLFNRIEHYLKHMKAIPKIATEDYPETRSPAPQPCEVTLLTEVEASVETHIPKSENQPNEDSTPLNNAFTISINCFNKT